MSTKLLGCLLTLVLLPAFITPARADQRQFINGLPDDPDFFPIGVWLQNPMHAQRYKDAGINIYISVHRGPTEEQLKALQKAGMPLIANQNDYARSLIESNDSLAEVIVGWKQQDEPDNAQRREEGEGWGPPVPPAEIVRRYEEMRSVDSTRPVYLNLGQGVAWEGWVGRGVQTGKIDDYPHYIQGGDIISFDIYPVANDREAIKGKLWYVARGTQRLRDWTNDDQIVWTFIEASRINTERVATPHEIRAQVWMAIIHGARGISYFVHEWNPEFHDHAMLANPTTREGVTRINREVQDLARVINSPDIEDGLTVRSSSEDVPVAAVLKREGGATYVFAVGMRDGTTDATFTIEGLADGVHVEVLGEDRTINVTNGEFRDKFEPWDVHLYRISNG